MHRSPYAHGWFVACDASHKFCDRAKQHVRSGKKVDVLVVVTMVSVVDVLMAGCAWRLGYGTDVWMSMAHGERIAWQLVKGSPHQKRGTTRISGLGWVNCGPLKRSHMSTPGWSSWSS